MSSLNVSRVAVFFVVLFLASLPASANSEVDRDQRLFREWQRAETSQSTNTGVLRLLHERPQGGAFTSVTDTYGSLVVRPGIYSVETPTKPWSSWWFPNADDYLFNPREGQPSPLARYDFYVRKTVGQSAGSARFEKTVLFQPKSVAWAGLCDAWSLASLLEVEPRTLVIKSGIGFRVGDQKALLLKSYENPTGVTHFGQRNNGKWDSVYEDLYPDQFHKFMQAEMFDKNKPFIMDDDAGIEVWSAPVWKAKTTVTADSVSKTIVHVSTWVTTASPHVTVFDFIGTEEVNRQYTYDLEGYYDSAQNFQVTSGVWTNRSRWDHPDYVIPLPSQLVRASLNTKIDPKVVDDILRH